MRVPESANGDARQGIQIALTLIVEQPGTFAVVVVGAIDDREELRHRRRARSNAQGIGEDAAAEVMKSLSEEDALRTALLALYAASEEDVGTGGPDAVRGIYPTAKLVSATGITDVEEARVASVYAALIAERQQEA